MNKPTRMSNVFFHDDKTALTAGQEFDNNIRLTIDPSLFLIWSCFIPSICQADSNKLFWEDLGYASPLIPYTFMYNISISLGVFGFTEHATRHIAMEDAEYIQPTYSGDTLGLKVKILSIEEDENGDFLIRSLHQLYNQKGKKVFQLKKTSLFPSTINARTGRIEIVDNMEELSNLESHIMSSCRNSSFIPYPRFDIEEGEFYTHDVIRPMAHCENIFFSTMLKNFHPNITTTVFDSCNTHIPEGHLIAIVQGLTSKEFAEYLCPEIEKSLTLRDIGTSSILGAFSYIMGKETANYDFETIYIRTFGTFDIDPNSSIDTKKLNSRMAGNITSLSMLKDELGPENTDLADHVFMILDWKIYRIKENQDSSFSI